MNQHRRPSAILLVLIAAVTPATRSQDANAHGHQTTAEPHWSALVGSMAKMHAALASVEPSGDSDVDFARLMLPHHQAAIDMVKTQLTHGKDPQMRRLAQEIITDQQSEMELTQLWLKRHEPSSHPVNPTPVSYVPQGH